MPIDDRTTNRSYQLPNQGNLLSDDVPRLRAALAAIDADVFARPTSAEVNQLLTDLIGGAPGALNTLNELAAAMGDDPNFAATMATQLALKADADDVYNKAEADARYVQGQTQAEMVFIATANQSAFTLSTPVINKPSALVTVDGVVQPTSEYSLNMAGTVLTLSEGVPLGTVVRVLALGVASVGAPGDDTVTTVKLRNDAVTTPKIVNGAVTEEKLANGAVGTAKLANAVVTPAKLSQPPTLGTVKAGTGAVIDYTLIPSWARRLKVAINGLSTNGASPIIILLGTSAGFQTTGYAGSVFNEVTTGGSAGGNYSGTAGFPLVYTWASGGLLTGMIEFININENVWVGSGQFGRADAAAFHRTAGAKDLGGVLDRLRITTANGTDAFDFGQVNLLFE
jgi:hypothetical protein